MPLEDDSFGGLIMWAAAGGTADSFAAWSSPDVDRSRGCGAPAA